MNPLLKAFAIILVLLAAGLGAIAFNIANRPAPVPELAAPPLAQAPAPRPQAAELHPVVVAAKALRAGAVLEPDALEIRQWPAPPDTGFTRIDSLLGKALRFDLSAGEPVTHAMIQQGLATYLNEGERAITIPVDDISGAATQLEAGDLVDVFFMLKHGQEIKDSQARLLLAKIRVLAYGARTVDAPVPSGETPQAKAGARTAILAIPTQRVNELLVAAENGKLLLAMRSPLDDSRPDPTLFAPRAPVLAGRSGLDADQAALLELPANIAYAGESLSQMAAGRASPDTPEAQHSTPSAGARSIQIIRAGRSQQVPY